MPRGLTSAPRLVLATLLLDFVLRGFLLVSTTSLDDGKTKEYLAEWPSIPEISWPKEFVTKVEGAAFEPTFTMPLQNQTVTLGRDVTFNCEVHRLGGYRVGWVKVDTKAIQAIHDHVITHNPRVSVSHAGHTTWSLHIKNVQLEDEGQYMCQINTDPMKSQLGYLSIVVPPDFIPEETSGDIVVQEGQGLILNCRASGHPTPTITWHREDGRDIFVRDYKRGMRARVNCFYGERLVMDKASRTDMAMYMCVASNGVPPAISKRITVNVNFFPLIQVPNQLVGAPLGTDVTLECLVEGFPKTIDYWVRDGGEMIIQSTKYKINSISKSSYESRVTLEIKNLQAPDFGTYRCVTKNSLGEVESSIRLYEIARPKGYLSGLEDQEEDDQGGSAEREEEEEQSNRVDEQSRGLTQTTPGGLRGQLTNAQENRVSGVAAPILSASLILSSLFLMFFRI